MLKNKKLLIITTLFTALPMLAGIILWNRLPEQMPTHWNAAGEIDGWSSKSFAVFGLPLFLAAMHVLCVVATKADPRKQNHGEKILKLVLFICQVISILTNTFVYLVALGIDVNIERIMPAVIGLTFIIVGNYLPKCKQNYTIGIKIPWTLHDEENWNQTHRIAGKVWVLGGLLMLIAVFLPSKVMMAAMIVTCVFLIFVPVIYSYNYHKKHSA